MADTIAGNTTTTATLSINTYDSSAIDFYGDTDWWKVSLIAGQTYVFDALGSYSGAGTLVDPWLGLLNSTGTLISFDDNSGYYSLSGRIVFTPSTTGTYYLDVEDSTANGFYDLGTYVIVAATDIGGSAATAAVLTAGVATSSSIQYSTDYDAFRFSVASPSIVTVNFDAPSGAPAYAFEITVFNGDVSPLTTWYPVSDFSFSFGAPVTGNYYIGIGPGTSYSEASYSVSVTTQSNNFGTNPTSSILPLSGDAVIDATTNGTYWSLDATRTITWAIADSGAGIWLDPYTALQRGTEIFSTIEAVANIDFKGIGYYTSPDAARLSGADIVVGVDAANVFFNSSSTWARSFFPYTGSEVGYYPGAAGDVWINSNSAANNLDYTSGSSGFFLMLHELGHSLGLKHPHDDGGTGRPTFAQAGIGGLDIDLATVMSYNDDFDWNLRAWEPATPMVLDVLGLQALYGANPNENSGNSTHQLLWNGSYQSIWDASGVDVVSAGSSSFGWLILLPTAIDDFGITTSITTKVGYALIADELNDPSPTTLYWLIGDIENATGSNQADEIAGNALANVLNGMAGDDTIIGGDGNDSLIGGADVDTVNYASAINPLTVQLARNSASGLDIGNDQIQEVENVIGGAAADIISGDGADNVLDGSTGADIIAGGPGNDTYVVDNSGDQVMELVNSGTDSVQSGVSYDLMQAWHVENLTLTGGGAIIGSGNWQNNLIIGNGASNVMDGDRGNDIVNGGGGSDTLIGGLGDDVLVYDAADGSVQGGVGSDTLRIDGSGVTLDLTAIGDSVIQDVEIIDITGTGNNTLTLALADVLAISSTTDALQIDGNAGDVVNAGSGWSTGGDQVIGLNTYYVYTQNIATLLVDSDITANVLA